MRFSTVCGWLYFVIASIEWFWMKYDFHVEGVQNWFLACLVLLLFVCGIFLISIRNSKL